MVGKGLFQTSQGRGRRRQSLLIPKYLADEANRFLKADGPFENAYRILCNWALLESSGKLAERTESSIEAEFLTDVFGSALGYALFSKGAPCWNLEPKFKLPDGQTADAAIGTFTPERRAVPRVLVELKGPRVDLDRDRSAGRTPVQQLWDYLNAIPECPWGILTNCVCFRLYRQGKTPRTYQEFWLQNLVEPKAFREFYTLFQKEGLLPVGAVQAARADRLLEKTDHRQREVGPELYEYYRDQRDLLIQHLRGEPHRMGLDPAIRASQKLLDRIIFIAFCEDQGLLPADSIDRAWTQLPAFSKATNPRWQNFKALFGFMNDGNPDLGIPPYDGGLFRADPEVDDLELEDTRTEVFRGIGGYDFSAEVSVEVLGHIFEQSVNDLEKLRAGSLLRETPVAAPPSKMDKSALRKRTGIYYTPTDFTEFITRETVGAAARAARDAAKRWFDRHDPLPPTAELWRRTFDAIRQIKVCDPACGSGAFLIRAYDVLEEQYGSVLEELAAFDPAQAAELEEQVPDIILADNLFGADLSREAVEITQLSLWIRSARPGKTLTDLSRNIVCGNSLVSDPAVHPLALDWTKTFPTVFDRPGSRKGFDCVIGNPPWERIKLQEREFFDASAPQIASAVSAATRRQLIAQLEKANPELYGRYVSAQDDAEKTLSHVRECGRFPLTAVGDINTYSVFAELARNLVAPLGRVGLLVPSGIATDNTTKDFFGDLIESKRLIALYDFENKKGLFPDVHRSFKFSILLFGGAEAQSQSADFVFFAHEMKELNVRKRHIALAPSDFKLLNPNTRTCPIFRSRRDAEITKAVYRRVPILLDRGRKKGGNPWGIRFFTMFHQTNDAELFHTPEQLQKQGFKPRGNRWAKGRKVFLPLYEAKMVQSYDHRAASVVVVEGNWMRQGQTEATSTAQHQTHDFLTTPRFWVPADAVEKAIGMTRHAFLVYKDVTSPTNERTMIAAFVPFVGLMNSAPVMLLRRGISWRAQCCLLANLNSFVYDFVARQKVGGLHLNFFIVEQLPVLHSDEYPKRCPWSPKQTLEKWVSDRVLKLSCTAEDMTALAEAAGLRPPVHKWDPGERAQLLAELDAAYFLLYNLDRDDADYVLSTFPVAGRGQEELMGTLTPREHILQEYDRLRKEIRF